MVPAELNVPPSRFVTVKVPLPPEIETHILKIDPHVPLPLVVHDVLAVYAELISARLASSPSSSMLVSAATHALLPAIARIISGSSGESRHVFESCSMVFVNMLPPVWSICG